MLSTFIDIYFVKSLFTDIFYKWAYNGTLQPELDSNLTKSPMLNALKLFETYQSVKCNFCVHVLSLGYRI